MAKPKYGNKAQTTNERVGRHRANKRAKDIAKVIEIVGPFPGLTRITGKRLNDFFRALEADRSLALEHWEMATIGCRQSLAKRWLAP
jgi:hypothetical protein